LVVPGVPSGYTVHAAIGDRTAEEVTACVPRRLLEVIRDAGHIRVLHVEREIQPPGKFAHEVGIGNGLFASQTMLEVQHCQLDTEFGREFAQHVEQADGIGAARDGDTHTRPRGQHAVTLDNGNDPPQHAVDAQCTPWYN
jgi:hypothetical protein